MLSCYMSQFFDVLRIGYKYGQAGRVDGTRLIVRLEEAGEQAVAIRTHDDKIVPFFKQVVEKGFSGLGPLCDPLDVTVMIAEPSGETRLFSRLRGLGGKADDLYPLRAKLREEIGELFDSEQRRPAAIVAKDNIVDPLETFGRQDHGAGR